MATAQRYTDALPLRVRMRLGEIDRRVEGKVRQLIEQHKRTDGFFYLGDLQEPLAAFVRDNLTPEDMGYNMGYIILRDALEEAIDEGHVTAQEAAQVWQLYQDKLADGVEARVNKNQRLVKARSAM